MKHDDIRHKLSEYIDGSITAEEKTEIDAHLNSCEACSRALQELQKTVGHIRSMEEVEPPVWMTQKIMAHVRTTAEEQEGGLSGLLHPARAAAPSQKTSAQSEAEQPVGAPSAPKKDGWFGRFFKPVLVRIPLQAVGVLFLAVTAFYLYRTMEPGRPVAESTYDKPPVIMQKNEEQAKAPEASSAEPLKDRFRAAEAPSVPAKKVPQSPGYKALDMKPEYEIPAPAVREEMPAAVAPAPAKPVEQPAAAGAPALSRQSAPQARAFSKDKQEQGEAFVGSASRAEDTDSRHALEKKKNDEQTAGRSQLKSSVAVTTADTEAAAQKRLIEHFTSRDLPQSMNVAGLTYTVTKLPAALLDRLQSNADAGKIAVTCTNNYRIDVELDSDRRQYFYCLDNSAIRLLGTYALEKGTWTRIQ